MSATLFSIEPFLAFLDKSPFETFSTSDSFDCAYARYLCSIGMKSPNVSDDRAKFTDANGHTHNIALPVELGQEHCKPAPGHTNKNIIAFSMLASRIRARMLDINTRRRLYSCTDLPMTNAQNWAHSCVHSAA